MRIGIVCPYSWDVPGGVQVHVRDLAEELIRRGHHVSVLAPADDDTPIPGYVVSAGRAVPVPYNGSVARVNFGPVSNARVRRWLSEGDFDVIHVHEPITPSLSILAVWAADVPVVATFHTANPRSRAMSAVHGIMQPALEKIAARIAVSEEARTTLVAHLGGDPVLIPNGVYVDTFASGTLRPEWRGGEDPDSTKATSEVSQELGSGATGGTGGTVCFLGRIDEARKGLQVMLSAWPSVVQARPHARLLVAGRGDIEEAAGQLPADVRGSVDFLGGISDEDKADMLATADIYVGPHLGGESFGIVLVEAMAAGATVVASDLVAFRAVLDDGQLGALFPVGDHEALARVLLELLADPQRREAYNMAAARAVRRYDWSTVTDQILAVYELVATTKATEVQR